MFGELSVETVRQIYIAAFTGIISGILFLIRKIFTSERQIDLLKQSLEQLQQDRKEHDESMDKQLSEIRHDIKNLLSRGSYL